MKKDLTEMTDRELLLELVAEKRREDKRRRLRLALRLLLLAALLLLACYLVQRILAALKSIDTALHSLQASSVQVGTGSPWVGPSLESLLDGLRGKLGK